MPPRLDLTGHSYGKLTVLRLADKSEVPPPRRHLGPSMWVCQCSCEDETVVLVTGNKLRAKSGATTSCGCAVRSGSRSGKFVDLTGHKYHRWTVIRMAQPSELTVAQKKDSRGVYWLCQCSCEDKTMRVLSSGRLRAKRNTNKSCGCIRREMVGINNPRYNPNLSDEDRMMMRVGINDSRLKVWRNEVLAMHGKRCVITGADQYLDCHHISSMLGAPALRFDPKNGLVLDRRIHNLFHSVLFYGAKLSSPSMVNEFVRVVRSFSESTLEKVYSLFDMKPSHQIFKFAHNINRIREVLLGEPQYRRVYAA